MKEHTGIIGTITTATGAVVANLAIINEAVQIIAGVVAIIVGLITIIHYCKKLKN